MVSRCSRIARRVRARDDNGCASPPAFLYSVTVEVATRQVSSAAEYLASSQGYDVNAVRGDRKRPGTDIALLLDPGINPPRCNARNSSVEEL